jgi:hypothetical protein
MRFAAAIVLLALWVAPASAYTCSDVAWGLKTFSPAQIQALGSQVPVGLKRQACNCYAAKKRFLAICKGTVKAKRRR